MSDLHYVSLTEEDLANINVALQIALPQSSKPEAIRTLQIKICRLRRLTTDSKDEANK